MCLRLRSTPNTKFLAEYLIKNFICENEKQGRVFSEKEIVAYTHAAVFLSSKVRERDIHCPMVPHIINAGGKCLSS